MIRIYLSRLLGERRICQAELSRRTGIRAATINELYHELVDRVNLDHLDRICEVLDCTLPELMEYIPNEQRKTGDALILEYHGNRNRRKKEP